jgi:hypothetical protein
VIERCGSGLKDEVTVRSGGYEGWLDVVRFGFEEGVGMRGLGVWYS